MARSSFGGYELIERIGRGGMAEVFRARVLGAAGFERPVAIKRILPRLAADRSFVDMLVDEAKITVRLAHPNIVEVHHLGRAEGTVFLAMEYVAGRDLRGVFDRERDREGAVPAALAIHIGMKICEALHHAHLACAPDGTPLQVIHRDISPQNVLLSWEGEVKVADFGLARARGRLVKTEAGVLKGKLAYLSPEQLLHVDIDHRVDVFALGVMLHELLAGRRLFLGRTDMETIHNIYRCEVPLLRTLNPDLPDGIDDVLRWALSKRRDRRPATAMDLHEELEAVKRHAGLHAAAPDLRRYLCGLFPEAAPPESWPPGAGSRPPPPLDLGKTFEDPPEPLGAARAEADGRGPPPHDEVSQTHGHDEERATLVYPRRRDGTGEG